MNTATVFLLILGLAAFAAAVGAAIAAARHMIEDLHSQIAVYVGIGIVSLVIMFLSVALLESYGIIPSLLSGPEFDGPARDTRQYEAEPIKKEPKRDLMDEAKQDQKKALKEFEEQ